MAKMATREAYGKALAELAKENKKILVLDADLSGSTKTGEVKKVAPEQHFNFGIAGQYDGSGCRYGNKRKHRICKYIRNVRCRTCV